MQGKSHTMIDARLGLITFDVPGCPVGREGQVIERIWPANLLVIKEKPLSTGPAFFLERIGLKSENDKL